MPDEHPVDSHFRSDCQLYPIVPTFVHLRNSRHETHSRIRAPAISWGSFADSLLTRRGDAGLHNRHRSTHPVAEYPSRQQCVPYPLSPIWRARAESFITYARDQLLHPKIGACARAYLLSGRGLQPETWDIFRLGYTPNDIYDRPSLWGFNDNDKKIWLPRGIVIPGIKDGIPWYIKIRRPLPNDTLAEYLYPPRNVIANPGVVKQSPPLLQSLPKPGPKFSGPRGGKSTLFGSDLWTGHQTLILTEGEWDCMLCWQLANDLADFATLGGASHRANYIDLTSLARFQKILAVYDSDEAGDQARKYLSSIPRIRTVTPPAHDLTDYFRLGGDLRTWIASILPRIQ